MLPLNFSTMRSLRFAYPAALLALILALAGACTPEGVESTSFRLVIAPVEVSRASVRDSIRVEAPRAICETGNIYALGHRLFVNEPRRGWHVFDNADASAPVAEAFWRVPGSTQLSYVNGYFVTDTYSDVVQLDFDGQDLAVVRGVDNGLAAYYGQLPAEGMVVTGLREEWVEIEVREGCGGAVDVDYGGFFCGVATRDDCWANYGIQFEGATLRANMDFADQSASGINVAGSLSRFGFGAEHLYVATEFGVYTFAVGQDSFTRSEHVAQGWELETAVVRDGYLYCGTPDGMNIYDLADAMAPEYLSRYTHVRGCDPVAVEGDRAVVTVREGSTCGSNNIGQLTLLDITDKTAPRVLAVYDMKHPHGVALYRGEVIVCEGDNGWVSGKIRGGGRNAITFESDYVLDPATDVAVLPYDPDSPTIFMVAPNGIRLYERAGDDGSWTLLSQVDRASCQ